MKKFLMLAIVLTLLAKPDNDLLYWGTFTVAIANGTVESPRQLRVMHVTGMFPLVTAELVDLDAPPPGAILPVRILGPARSCRMAMWRFSWDCCWSWCIWEILI